MGDQSSHTISTKHPIFKANLKAYYKVRQLVIIKCDSLVLQSAPITSCKVSQVLQIVTGITKCDDYCKVRQNMNIRKSEITEF